jgi:DNA-binding MarR family transcriptional regulator
MSDQEVSQTTGFLIAQICRAYRNLAAEKLNELGLHPGQEMLLCELWNEDGLTQSELAQRLSVQPATVSKMLSRMGSLDLVSTCRDARDGRAVRITLTEAGRHLHEPLQEAWMALETRTLATMGPEETEVLCRLLHQVLHNLTQPQVAD